MRLFRVRIYEVGKFDAAQTMWIITISGSGEIYSQSESCILK